MTNKEYIVAKLSKFDVEDSDIEIVLVENELNPDSNVDVKACKTAVCKSLSQWIPVSNVQEGGFSRSWNIDALKLYYESLCKELGVTSVIQPSVRNMSNVW